MTAYGLNPQPVPVGTQNEDPVVLRIVYGDTQFLFTGDIGSSTEQVILNSGTPITATVLKVAHHGSKYSSSASFLNAVKPKLAIISVKHNSDDHPAQETLDRLSAVGAKIYRTDQNGTLVVTSDGQTVKVDLHYIFLPLVIRQATSASPPDLRITTLSGTTTPEYDPELWCRCSEYDGLVFGERGRAANTLPAIGQHGCTRGNHTH
jgi:competence protein ComEC